MEGLEKTFIGFSNKYVLISKYLISTYIGSITFVQSFIVRA